VLYNRERNLTQFCVYNIVVYVVVKRCWRLKLQFIGPILWGHSGPLCHALSLLSLWTSILHCNAPGVATVARRLHYSYSWLRLILVVVSTVETPGEWQCKIRTGVVRRLAVANEPKFFQMLLVNLANNRQHTQTTWQHQTHSVRTVLCPVWTHTQTHAHRQTDCYTGPP